MGQTDIIEDNGKSQKRYVWRRPKRTEHRFRWPDRLVPHVPFMILFILAAFQYNARLTGETSLITFQVINHEFFWTPEHNVGLYLSQLIPLTGIWLGLETRVILLLFSVSHIAFYYILFLLVYYGMGDRRSGLLILLIQTFGIIHSFFSPASSLFYMASLLVVFYALLRLNIRVVLMSIFLVLVELTALLTHPAAFLLFPFLLLFDFNKESLSNYRLYIVLFLFYCGTFWFENIYTGKSFLDSFLPFFTNIKPQSFVRDSSGIFKFLFNYYPELILSVPIILFSFLKGRKWVSLLISISLSVYWILFLPGIITLPALSREQAMFPIIFVVASALVYSYPKAWNPGASYLSIFFISFFIMIRILIIYNHSSLYVMRARQITHISESAWRYSGSKFIAKSEVINRYHVASTDSYPIESLLLSSCFGTDRSVTIIPDSSAFTKKLKSWPAIKEIFLSPNLTLPISYINGAHLNLDLGQYKLLNMPKINLPVNELADVFYTDILAKKFYQAGDTIFIPVKISSPSKDTLFTGGDNRVYLSYFWLKNSEPLEWNNILTPVDTDIIKELRQDVKVCIPETKGWYDLNVDLNVDGQWLGLRSKKRILVY